MTVKSILGALSGSLALAAAAALPAAAAGPAATLVTRATGTCVVAAVPGLSGTTTVTSSGTQLAPSFLDLTGCQAPAAIVTRIGATGIEKPFAAQGFRCTPSISGASGRWTCRFQAADTSGQITLTFRTRYR